MGLGVMWPYQSDVARYEAPPKGWHVVDSDRIGWHKFELSLKDIIPLIESRCNVKDVVIHEVWAWNNVSSGYPGFSIFYTAD